MQIWTKYGVPIAFTLISVLFGIKNSDEMRDIFIIVSFLIIASIISGVIFSEIARLVFLSLSSLIFLAGSVYFAATEAKFPYIFSAIACFAMFSYLYKRVKDYLSV